MHAAFRKNRLFVGLTDAVVARIYWLGEVREVEAGEVIVEEREENDHMYLLLDGKFKVSRPARQGRLSPLTLGYRGRGDLIGEYSLIDRLPAAATVTAEEKGSLFRVDHDALRNLLATSAEISTVIYQNMLGYLVSRLRAQDDELDFFV